MTAPTRRDVADYLAALTDEELASTIAEARATTHIQQSRTTRQRTTQASRHPTPNHPPLRRTG